MTAAERANFLRVIDGLQQLGVNVARALMQAQIALEAAGLVLAETRAAIEAAPESDDA